MYCKRTIRDIDVTGRRVLVRVDFNVPIADPGEIAERGRIEAALPTIRNLLNRGAAVILMSDLGRPSGDRSKDKPSRLDRAVGHLKEFLPSVKVTKADDVVGPSAKRLVGQLEPGCLLALENLRFNPGEKSSDEGFARQLRNLGDVYVNDAFAACHRKYASTYALPRMFPKERRGIGLLIESELTAIGRILRSPRRPFVAVLGGTEVAGKLGLIESLQDHQVDRLLIGGLMSYTFLKADGISIGATEVQSEELEGARALLRRASHRIILPTDHVVTASLETPTHVATTEGDIEAGWYGRDIGAYTVESFCKTIASAGTVVWNGPPGMFEEQQFRKGTEAIARAIAESPAISLIGGGSTAAAVDQFGLRDEMTHVSTGRDAFLKYLETGALPALSVIESYQQSG